MKKGLQYRVRVDEIARAFGVSQAKIRDFVLLGMPRESRGVYDLADCFAWRMGDLESQCEKTMKGLSKDEQELRLRTSQADLKEVLDEIDSGSRAPVELVERNVCRYLLECKSKFLALPSRMAVVLLGYSGDREIIARALKAEVDVACRELNQDVLANHEVADA